METKNDNDNDITYFNDDTCINYLKNMYDKIYRRITPEDTNDALTKYLQNEILGDDDKKIGFEEHHCECASCEMFQIIYNDQKYDVLVLYSDNCDLLLQMLQMIQSLLSPPINSTDPVDLNLNNNCKDDVCVFNLMKDYNNNNNNNNPIIYLFDINLYDDNLEDTWTNILPISYHTFDMRIYKYKDIIYTAGHNKSCQYLILFCLIYLDFLMRISTNNLTTEESITLTRFFYDQDFNLKETKLIIDLMRWFCDYLSFPQKDKIMNHQKQKQKQKIVLFPYFSFLYDKKSKDGNY